MIDVFLRIIEIKISGNIPLSKKENIILNELQNKNIAALEKELGIKHAKKEKSSDYFEEDEFLEED